MKQYTIILLSIVVIGFALQNSNVSQCNIQCGVDKPVCCMGDPLQCRYPTLFTTLYVDSHGQCVLQLSPIATIAIAIIIGIAIALFIFAIAVLQQHYNNDTLNDAETDPILRILISSNEVL